MEDLLLEITRWGRSRATVRAIVLVGSYARGTARPDSDVDVLCLVTNPDLFRPPAWLSDVSWPTTYGGVTKWEDKAYGAVWSRHLQLENGLSVELSFGPIDWASTTPVDEGTRAVMQGGHRTLYDPDDLLAMLIDSL